MTTPNHRPNQTPTAYTNLADYERDRAAREADGMAQAFSNLLAESIAAQNPTVEHSIQPTPQTGTVGQEVVDVVPSVEPLAIRADVELMRMAVGLGMGREAQLWLVLLETVRETGKNYVLKADLSALLEKYHIRCSGRNLTRWLRKGQHFWIVTPTRVRFIGYRQVAKNLTTDAREKRLNGLISTNLPGQRRFMYIPISSDQLSQFEASVYASWLNARNNPKIARKTLSTLFNRDASVLREWEQIAGVTVIQNFGHITSEYSDRVPQTQTGEFREDVHEYRANGSTRWKVQLPNTYHAPAVKQHPKRGQSRRVAREILECVESDKPAGTNAQGDNSIVTGGLDRLDKMYFEDSPKKTAASKAKAAFEYGKQGDKWLAVGQPHNHKYQHVYAPDGVQRATASECWPQYAGWVQYA